jgi:hypothetical protein
MARKYRSGLAAPPSGGISAVFVSTAVRGCLTVIPTSRISRADTTAVFQAYRMSHAIWLYTFGDTVDVAGDACADRPTTRAVAGM